MVMRLRKSGVPYVRSLEGQDGRRKVMSNTLVKMLGSVP
jgi:hypothetical protein